ncbi:diacylglycerol kinase [Halobacteriales archaeon SW_5_70_135]|nr:MAG: diacylglycerol kinase [Halobacteriales archaeon SW_5_70_135]
MNTSETGSGGQDTDAAESTVTDTHSDTDTETSVDTDTHGNPDAESAGRDGDQQVERGEAGGRSGEERVLILNPQSGNGDHAEQVHELAGEHDVEVVETEAAGDSLALARERAPEADLLAACGGDGTLNEVVRGAREVDALDGTELAVVPGGTGNNFAGNVGVDSIPHAFEVIEEGRTRAVDLGVANGRPFVNSCICGLTADASGDTSSGLKASLGAFAYVVNTLQALRGFDGMRLHVETGPKSDREFVGDALFVLIGNGRRFPASGPTQANVEDGLHEVTVIENASVPKLLGDRVIDKLFGDEAAAETHRKQAAELEVTSLDGEEVGFSLDGEMIESDGLSVWTESGAVRLRVGEGYEVDPAPPGEGGAVGGS